MQFIHNLVIHFLGGFISLSILLHFSPMYTTLPVVERTIWYDVYYKIHIKVHVQPNHLFGVAFFSFDRNGNRIKSVRNLED